MSNPGVGVRSGGGGSSAVGSKIGSMPPSTESSRDGAAGVDFSGALQSALLGIGQGPVPADQQQFADLLGSRLKTEDVLQVKWVEYPQSMLLEVPELLSSLLQGTLRHMFQKLNDQEVLVGQLQQTVMDLETSHQPWPRSQFEEAMGKLERMGARLETLPPDTALVTKKYLKEYDNSWMKRWNEMERANEERFDRLETRLASFEEAVLRVELKIEHDMKQCLVELNKGMTRLDEVEETGRQAMANGFERVERDISDLTLRLKEEGERITEREVEAGKTAEQVVDAVMDAEETKGRLARVEGRMAESAAEQRAALESAKKELMEDISAVNDAVIVAQEKAAALQSETASMKTALNTLEEGVMGAHGSLAQHAANIQQQASVIQALQDATQAAQERAANAAAAAPRSQGGTAKGSGSPGSSRVAIPGRETSMQSIGADSASGIPVERSEGAGAGAFAFTGSEERLGAEGSFGSGGGGAVLPPTRAGSMAPPATALDGPGLKFAVQTILDQTLTQSIDDAMDGKVAELQDVFRKMIDKMAVDLAELRSVVEKRGRQLDATEKHAKATAEIAEEMKNDVEMLMSNVCLKEEQDRWRASVEGFTKDLEYFKKKYSRHLGLQVENYTVAGMAKEEDLAKLSANVEDKVSRKELQAVLDRAVQRSMDMYSSMQRQQDVDRMVVAGTGHLLQSRCMACDRDMTMVGANDMPSLGSGLLTAGARSLSPSKSPIGKSKGFLPKIKSSGGPLGPGFNPMEMKRLQRIADQYEGAAVERPKTSPPTEEAAAAAAAVTAQESSELKEW